jgi:putative redox protein
VSEAETKTNVAVARWEGDWRARVRTGDFELVVDEPPSAGGTGTGPQPTDYLMTALASCFTLAVAWAARKRDVHLPDLEVRATGTYDGPRFKHLRLTVTSSLPAEQLRPLLEPARRACYVSNTLALSPPIEVEIG